jgi:hypothetical protein
MKKSALYILSLLLLFSCKKKTDVLFDKSADERIAEALSAYDAALQAAPGWKLFVYPKGLESQDIEVGGLTYYVKFGANNRVTMVSDFTFFMALTPNEAGYRLKATQRPSLIFDTYSYMHAAADPDPNVSFSPTGEGGYGWGTDFDFAFTEAKPTGDTIQLEGNFNRSKAILIKATQAEMTAAFSPQQRLLGYIMAVTSDYAVDNPFLYLPSTTGAKIGVSLNLYLYRINFNFISGGQLVQVSAPFSHTTYGLHLKDPITIGGYTFQDLYWDDTLGVYYIRVGTTRINITNSATPLFPFYQALGRTISSVSVPTTALPGQSALFTSTYNTVKTNLKTGTYGLDLGTIDFIFDDQSKAMAMNINVTQAGQPFVIQYVFTYTMSTANIAKFTIVGANGNGNNQAIFNQVRPLLVYIANDRFKLDYYGPDPTLGQFTSQENPTFFFTGNLQ